MKENRILKFRVWDKQNKKFFKNQELFLGLDSCLYINIDGDFESISIEGINPNKYIIQQFTNLYDKNKKEIYEGDIVTWGMWRSPCKGVVKYNPEEAAYIVDYSFAEDFNYLSDFEVEVVGNICENPEIYEKRTN